MMAKENVELYKVVGGQTREQFLREAYIDLYSSFLTQEEIDNAEFSELQESEVQIAYGSATFDVDYTASIGYNVGTFQEDWKPFSGKETANGKGHLFLNDESDRKEWPFDDPRDFGRIECYVDEIVNKAFESEDAGKITINDSDHLGLMAYCSGDAERLVEKVGVPGDAVKDFRAKSTLIEEGAVDVVSMFRRRLTFRAEGQDKLGVIDGFEVEKRTRMYYVPQGIDTTGDELDAACALEKEKSNKLKKNRIISWGGVGLIALGSVIGGVGHILSALGVAIVLYSLLVLGKKTESITDDIYKKYKDLKTNHVIEIQNKKMALLEARFARMGLAPLTDEEKKQFELDDHYINAYYEGKSPSKNCEKEDW